MQIADFSNERDGGDELDATQGLKGHDDRSGRPFFQSFGQHLFQPLAAVSEFMDAALVLLEDILPMREGEDLFREPAPPWRWEIFRGRSLPAPATLSMFLNAAHANIAWLIPPFLLRRFLFVWCRPYPV